MVLGRPLKEDRAMDATTDFSLVASQNEEPVAPRLAAAVAVEQFGQLDSPWTSRSKIARRLHIPDSTLRYWLRTRRRNHEKKVTLH